PGARQGAQLGQERGQRLAGDAELGGRARHPDAGGAAGLGAVDADQAVGDDAAHGGGVTDVAQVRQRLYGERADAGVEGDGQLVGGLAAPAVEDLGGVEPGRERRVQLAGRADLGAGAALAEGTADLRMRVGLEGEVAGDPVGQGRLEVVVGGGDLVQVVHVQGAPEAGGEVVVADAHPRVSSSSRASRARSFLPLSVSGKAGRTWQAAGVLAGSRRSRMPRSTSCGSSSPSTKITRSWPSPGGRAAAARTPGTSRAAASISTVLIRVPRRLNMSSRRPSKYRKPSSSRWP